MLPDTLYHDSVYIGVIHYDGALDSINVPLNDYKMLDTVSRYKDRRELFCFYRITDSLIPKKDFEKKLKVIKYDTLYGLWKKRVVFANEFKFNKLGVNYIDGYIDDNVFLEKDNGEVRWIQNRYRIIHKLFVIKK